MNIIDPVGLNNNLAKAVDTAGFESICASFREGYKLFQLLCEAGAKTGSPAPTLPGALHHEGIVKAVKSCLVNTMIRSTGAVARIRQSQTPLNVLCAASFKSQTNQLQV
jgi:hypothetical protein